MTDIDIYHHISEVSENAIDVIPLDTITTPFDLPQTKLTYFCGSCLLSKMITTTSTTNNSTKNVKSPTVSGMFSFCDWFTVILIPKKDYRRGKILCHIKGLDDQLNSVDQHFLIK